MFSYFLIIYVNMIYRFQIWFLKFETKTFQDTARRTTDEKINENYLRFLSLLWFGLIYVNMIYRFQNRSLKFETKTFQDTARRTTDEKINENYLRFFSLLWFGLVVYKQVLSPISILCLHMTTNFKVRKLLSRKPARRNARSV